MAGLSCALSGASCCVLPNSGADNRNFVQNVIQAPNLAWWFPRVYLTNLPDVPFKNLNFKIDAKCVCRKWFCSKKCMYLIDMNDLGVNFYAESIFFTFTSIIIL